MRYSDLRKLHLPAHHYCLFILLLLGGIDLSAQCSIEQNAQNSTAYGGPLGQSFIAECSGNFTFLSVTMHPGTTDGGTARLDIKNENCDTMWTLMSVTLPSGMPVTFDLSLGSGDSRFLQSGEVYSFHFSNLSNTAIFRANSISPYAGGCWMDNDCGCISSADIMFEVEIDDTPAPVTLTNFTLTPARQQVDLHWQTADETNNAGFEIERSMDGRNWNRIGFVAGNGTSSELNEYTYRDINLPDHKLLYYRLKQLDFDGQFEYSPVRVAHFDTQPGKVNLYPSPATDQLILSGLERQQEVIIFDQNGREVLRSLTQSRVAIDQMTPGVYFLRVQGDQVKNLRFIKQ